MDDYWRSPAAVERRFRDRWLRTARAVLNQEPRRKGKAGNVEAGPFRAAVRDAVAMQPDWPRPRAALALDLDFTTSRRQPPGLWTLPKHYLDLLGQTSAPVDDPGSVLYRDDRQVKLLFVSCRHDWQPDGTATGRIHIEARTRSSALADMQLAGELIEHEDELCGNSPMGERFDPWLAMASEDDRQYLPPNLAQWSEFHDQARYQEWLLGSNDRMLRGVFFGAGHSLLTGTDPHARRLQRLALTSSSSVLGVAERNHAETNDGYRKLLDSSIRIELPPLPIHKGDGASFNQGIRKACRDFIKRYPQLEPLVVPLRVTVLVVPPKRAAANVKDLDNILMDVLRAMEDELKPHAEPWLLAPPVDGPNAPPSQQEGEGLTRLRTISGSNTWAYQVLELHRRPNDPDQGSLTLVPGLGWNRKSLWKEAEQVVEQRLEELLER